MLRPYDSGKCGLLQRIGMREWVGVIYRRGEAFGGGCGDFLIDLRPNASPSRQEIDGGDRRESVCGNGGLS
jgi:hypothetical protein